MDAALKYLSDATQIRKDGKYIVISTYIFFLFSFFLNEAVIVSVTSKKKLQ